MSTATSPATGLWHGLVALGQHMHTHQLADPTELDLADTRLTVHLAGHTASTWVDSLHVDELTRQAGYGPLQWVTVKGRLPETGVRVRLTWSEVNRSRPAAPARRGGPVKVGEAVAEVLPEIAPKCQDCGTALSVGVPVHGEERGQTLCGACCHAGNPCSWRACCDEGAIR